MCRARFKAPWIPMCFQILDSQARGLKWGVIFFLLVGGISFVVPAQASDNAQLFSALEKGNLRPLRKAPKEQLRQARNQEDASLLIVAVQKDQAPARDFLLRSDRSEVNHRDQAGQTALYYAVSQGNLASVKALVRAGADLGLVYGDEKETVLFEAVRVGPPALVDVLLKPQPALIEVTKAGGANVFEEAVMAAQYRLAKDLLEKHGARWPDSPTRRQALFSILQSSKDKAAQGLVLTAPKN